MKKLFNSTVLITLGICCILASIGWTGYNYYQDQQVGDRTDDIEDQLEEYIFHTVHAAEDVTITSSDGSVADSEYYFEGFDPEMYEGILEIPLVGLRLPVYKEFSGEQLLSTPCVFYGSIEEDHLVIGAHNYTSHFNAIRYGREGQIVYFYDINGTRHKYIIDKSENLEPSQTEELCKSDYELTLFTCTWYGYLRVAVRCYEVYE